MHVIAFTLLTSLLATVDAGGAGSSTARDEVATTAESPPPAQPAAEPRLPASAFATERRPRARRTQKWTQPRRDFSPRWESDYPKVHFSRFLDLARPEFHPPKIHTLSEREWQTALFRFASDVIADLHDALHLACPTGRCLPSLAEADQRLAAFVRAGARAFTQVERKSGPDALSAWYGWRLTGGTASFELGCNDTTAAPEVTCRLEIELDDGLVLVYAPKHSRSGQAPDITVWQKGDAQRKSLGEIQFDHTYSGSPVVIISGKVLAEMD